MDDDILIIGGNYPRKGTQFGPNGERWESTMPTGKYILVGACELITRDGNRIPAIKLIQILENSPFGRCWYLHS